MDSKPSTPAAACGIRRVRLLRGRQGALGQRCPSQAQGCTAGRLRLAHSFLTAAQLAEYQPVLACAMKGNPPSHAADRRHPAVAPGWREVATLRKKLEELRELRDLVRQLGSGGGKGPLKKAPEQVGVEGFGVAKDAKDAWGWDGLLVGEGMVLWQRGTWRLQGPAWTMISHNS